MTASYRIRAGVGVLLTDADMKAFYGKAPDDDLGDIFFMNKKYDLLDTMYMGNAYAKNSSYWAVVVKSTSIEQDIDEEPRTVSRKKTRISDAEAAQLTEAMAEYFSRPSVSPVDFCEANAEFILGGSVG